MDEHSKCYVFKPSEARPAKRRKVDHTKSTKELRLDTYKSTWQQHERKINASMEVVETSNEATLSNIVSFVRNVPKPRHTSKLPTGLVVAGPSIASHRTLFDQLSRGITDAGSAFVLLNSADGSNLKGLLTNLIKKATSSKDEEDEEVITKKSRKLLKYDLQILYEWSKERGGRQVVIAFQDSEAFDGSLVAEVVSVLSSWSDRIPLILLFGIGTSIDNFHDKIPRSALKHMEGEVFDVQQADEVLEQAFLSTVEGEHFTVRLGPSMCNLLLDRQKDHIQSIQEFSNGLKYALMSHFYANIVSVFCAEEKDLKNIPKDHQEALRNLPSFRTYVESLLDAGNTERVRDLITSDQYLHAEVLALVASGREKLFRLVDGCRLLHRLLPVFPRLAQPRRSALYIRAMAGDLRESPLVRELLLSIKKASSDVLLQLLKAILETSNPDEVPPELNPLRSQLEELLQNAEKPLRSEHDIGHETLRTTVVSRKVELSKQKASLSKQDTAYSSILVEFHEHLQRYLDQTLIDPGSLPFHEVFIYDLKSPHRDAFMPRPRPAIERALASPHDYLGCGCCQPSSGEKGEKSTLSASQPPTSILYLLTLESGPLINVADLWTAFAAVLGNDESEESQTMALFQRSLAELKLLGMIKPSGKKTDHVAKTMWRGL